MSGDKKFDDNEQPLKTRPPFQIDEELLEKAREAKKVIEKEEKRGETEE